MDDKESDAKREALEWTGHWWLPGNPEEKLPGVLHPDTERGPELALTGYIAKLGDYGRLEEIIHDAVSLREQGTQE